MCGVGYFFSYFPYFSLNGSFTPLGLFAAWKSACRNLKIKSFQRAIPLKSGTLYIFCVCNCNMHSSSCQKYAYKPSILRSIAIYSTIRFLWLAISQTLFFCMSCIFKNLIDKNAELNKNKFLDFSSILIKKIKYYGIWWKFWKEQRNTNLMF